MLITQGFSLFFFCMLYSQLGFERLLLYVHFRGCNPLNKALAILFCSFWIFPRIGADCCGASGGQYFLPVQHWLVGFSGAEGQPQRVIVQESLEKMLQMMLT